jgi:hypothetical protein
MLLLQDLLLRDLYAFYLEHERCGELDGGVEGEIVWITCGAGIHRCDVIRRDGLSKRSLGIAEARGLKHVLDGKIATWHEMELLDETLDGQSEGEPMSTKRAKSQIFAVGNPLIWASLTEVAARGGVRAASS